MPLRRASHQYHWFPLGDMGTHWPQWRHSHLVSLGDSTQVEEKSSGVPGLPAPAGTPSPQQYPSTQASPVPELFQVLLLRLFAEPTCPKGSHHCRCPHGLRCLLVPCGHCVRLSITSVHSDKQRNYGDLGAFDQSSSKHLLNVFHVHTPLTQRWSASLTEWAS